MKLPFTLSKGLEQTAVTVGGNLFATGISSVALIIISRYLGPTAFGEFSVGFALIMILTKLNDFGLNTAIFAHVDHRQPSTKTNAVLSSILLLKLSISGIILLVSLLLYFFFGSLLKLDHPEIILISILFSFVATYFEHVIAVLQSLHSFYKAVVIYVMQSLTKLVIALMLLWQVKLSLLTTFSFYSLAPISSFITMLFIWPKEYTLNLSVAKMSVITKVFTTAKHTAMNTISQSLADNVSIFFVQAYLSSYETGLLGGVSKIVLLFTLISYFLSQVLYPRVAKYTSKKDRSAYLLKASIMTAGILLSSVSILPLGKLSILLTIGPSFLTGLPILYVLLFAAFFQIAAVPFSALFFALKDFWYFTWSGVLQIVLLCLGNVLVIPYYGLAGAAYVILLTRVLIFILTLVLSIWLHLKKQRKSFA